MDERFHYSLIGIVNPANPAWNGKLFFEKSPIAQ